MIKQELTSESCPNPYLRVFPIKEVADTNQKRVFL